MHNVMIAGAGKIGSLMASILAETKSYQIFLADVHFKGTDAVSILKNIPTIRTLTVDFKQKSAICENIKKNKITAIVSCLPFYLNPLVAEACNEYQIHYFDLTEDRKVTETIKKLAIGTKSAFVPQCGLAPGFIGIVANSLMQDFDSLYHAYLRVGALPQYSANSLHYALTWSTDGLINEYGNICHGIENGLEVSLKPLEGLEEIELDGCMYEAFNTSGGVGSLVDLYKSKIKTLNYKTIRYPGHAEKIRFLMNELKLNEDRITLKNIFERAIPKTYQDVVIIYVNVQGIKDNELRDKSFFKKIYPKKILDISWSAIQVSTVAGACAIVDLVLSSLNKYSGLILQENFTLEEVLNNRFGIYFA